MLKMRPALYFPAACDTVQVTQDRRQVQTGRVFGSARVNIFAQFKQAADPLNNKVNYRTLGIRTANDYPHHSAAFSM